MLFCADALFLQHNVIFMERIANIAIAMYQKTKAKSLFTAEVRYDSKA